MVDVTSGAIRVVAENGRQPDVRNDGRIAFNGVGGGRDDLQTVSPDGRSLAALSVHPEDSAPRWSDDGTSVAFHSALAGGDNDRLFIQPDASHREEPMHLQYGNSPLYGRYPFWTSDGLGYSGCIGGGCGIWVTGLKWAPKISQTFRRQLTTFPEDRVTDIHGDTIVFTSPRTGSWELYSMSAMGGKSRNLTNSPSQDLGGTFSPDGAYIAFMSDRGGGWGIWIMEADGAGPRLLATVPQGFGQEWSAERLSWGP
jgi:Tol biopolymer transport system component